MRGGQGLDEEMSCHGVPRYVISGGVLVVDQIGVCSGERRGM